MHQLYLAPLYIFRDQSLHREVICDRREDGTFVPLRYVDGPEYSTTMRPIVWLKATFHFEFPGSAAGNRPMATGENPPEARARSLDCSKKKEAV
jgi:hypothetical protein